MRLWTAIMGWAALLALSVALYALGLTLEELHKDHGSELVLVAVVMGGIATFIFAGDLVFLAYGPVTRAIAARKPRFGLGLLDYIPEFLASMEGIQQAMDQINGGMNVSTKNMVEKADQFKEEQDPKLKQALATATAKGIDDFRDILTTNVPILNVKSFRAREAVTGYLSRATDEKSEIVNFRNNLRGLIASTKTAKASIGTMRDRVRWFYRLNLSAALNGSSKELWRSVEEYEKTLTKMERDWRAVGRAVTRKLWRLSIRRLVPRKAAHRLE